MNNDRTNQLNRRQLLGAAGAVTAGVVLANTASVNADSHAAAEPTHAIAVMRPTKDNKVRGSVRFAMTNKGVRVIANIKGLEPKSKHAIHIHQYGDISKPDGTGTGGHYNPEGHDHALPEKEKRHAGDLGNLEADDEGNAKYSITVTNISIAGKKNPIAGRGVIIHAKVDDGGQPTGNAGPRIAQGAIGIAPKPVRKEGAKKENAKK